MDIKLQAEVSIAEVKALLAYLWLKGGAGSGNWGHAGRPGKRGGSMNRGQAMSRTTGQDWQARQAAAKGKPAPVDKKPASFAKDFDMAEYGQKLRTRGMPIMDVSNNLARLDAAPETVQKFVAGLIDYDDAATGLRIGAIQYDTPFGSHVVGANIVDKNGRQVGFVQRRFEGKKVVHTEFKLDDEYQDKGFGSRFYVASEQTYKAMGIKQIDLMANLDVGGYAWARMGFSTKREADFAYLKKVVGENYKKTTGKFIPVTPQNMAELAAVTGPNGERIGKETLLGTGWTATKRLDDADPGYQAGQEYYRQKGLID